VEGKSVIRYDPTGQAARWYRRLADEVIARDPRTHHGRAAA
jgi:nitrogenase subunit NifH